MREIVDNDQEASSGRVRPGYAEAMEMVETGAVDAIVVWELSRLWRNRKERAEGMEILARARVAIHPVRGPALDPTTAAGALLIDVLGAFDTAEGAVRRERNLAKARELAEAGKIGSGGVRPFGYKRTYSGEGNRRKIVKDELDPIEAPIVREMVRRRLAGESTHQICKWLNENKIKTSTGKAWSHQAVRALLRAGRIAGWREHHDVLIAKATWPAIISLEQHQALRALIDANKGKTKNPAPRRHHLTGLVYCGKCGGKLAASSRRCEEIYACRGTAVGGCGGITIRIDVIVGWTDNLVMERLGEPEFSASLRARVASRTAGPRTELRNRMEAAQARLEALRAALVTADADTVAVLAGAVADVSAEIRAGRAEMVTQEDPLAAVDVLELIDEWRDLEFETKLKMCRALIERIDIAPANRNIPTGSIDTDRIKVTWRTPG